MGDMITSEAIDLALQNTILARQGDRAAKLAEKGIELQSEKAIMLLKKGKPELLESNFDT
jgi:dynein heavy chain